VAKLAKLPTSRLARQIWESLVSYANAPDDRGRASPEMLEAFKAALSRCMNLISGCDEDLENCGDIKGGASLSGLAVRYRPDIRRVLTWVSAPDRRTDLADRASRFLSDYAAGLRMYISANGHKADTDDPLLLQWPEFCESVIAPVCKFIIEQIERHDLWGEALKDVIPIGSCKRSGCDRFFMIERAGRGRFCSDKCRAGAYQDKLTPDQRAARMRKHRATRKEQEMGWIKKGKSSK
jgi:hypothetical protein